MSSTSWQRRGDLHFAFSTACVVSHACCWGTSAASSCSHQCSVTVLEDCFGLIVDTGTQITGVRYPLDPQEKRTPITAPRRASLCLFHSFLAPHWLSSLTPEKSFILFQSGAWGICSAVLHVELHFAMLTASKKLRAGSVLQCRTWHERRRSRKLPEIDTKVCKH